MIRVLKHIEIDKQKWDDCLFRSSQPRPYCYSQYLDLVSPNWEALIEIEEGTYRNIFPVPVKTKWSFTYTLRLPFTQQLGVYGKDEKDAKVVFHFLNKAFQHYRYGDFFLQALNPLDASINHNELRNYTLDLNDSYESLIKSYSKNRKRNIQKSVKEGCQIEEGKIETLLELVDGSEKIQLSVSEKTFLKKLSDIEDKLLKPIIFNCCSPEGEVLSSSFFIEFKNRITYLVGSSTEEGYRNGASTYIFDCVIRKYSGENVVLDFEGSNIPGIASFYQSFGAKEETYSSVHLNRLPQSLNF